MAESDTSDLVQLQAEIADMKRRLHSLEVQVHGAASYALPPMILAGIYADALLRVELTASWHRVWVRYALILDVRQYLEIARMTGDPHPWRTILHILLKFQKVKFDVTEAYEHTMKVAQDMLNAQGLELIKPMDVMARTVTIPAILSTISDEED